MNAKVVRALVALAAVLLVVAPAMDALARDHVLTASPAPLGRVLAAFDAVDAAIAHRHDHGKAPAAQPHHVQIAAMPQARAGDAPALSEHPLAWSSPVEPDLKDADLSLPDHPPRG